MKHLSATSLIVLIAVGVGCNDPTPAPSKEPGQTAATNVPAATAQAAKPHGEEHAKKGDVLDGCPGDESMCTGASSADQTHFGKAFELTATEPLVEATKRLGADAKPTKVQVSGTVDAVCQKKGCWMVLRDGDLTARVFTHAGGFFLPVGTSKGRKCKVEGELKEKTVTEKFAKHLEEDGAGDPTKIDGDRREWVMDATTIELL